jgi:hypothetical protein
LTEWKNGGYDGMSEKRNYALLRAKLIKGKKDRFDRVENVMVVGMPDINLCCDGVELWIEMKNATEPKKDTSKLLKHKLSQDQQNWIKRQIDAGGRCYIMVVTDKRWMLVDGTHADFINYMNVKDMLRIALWTATKPVKSKEWPKLHSILRNKVIYE